jgi:hypothetical protein
VLTQPMPGRKPRTNPNFTNNHSRERFLCPEGYDSVESIISSSSAHLLSRSYDLAGALPKGMLESATGHVLAHLVKCCTMLYLQRQSLTVVCPPKLTLLSPFPKFLPKNVIWWLHVHITGMCQHFICALPIFMQTFPYVSRNMHKVIRERKGDRLVIMSLWMCRSMRHTYYRLAQDFATCYAQVYLPITLVRTTARIVTTYTDIMCVTHAFTRAVLNFDTICCRIRPRNSCRSTINRDIRSEAQESGMWGRHVNNGIEIYRNLHCLHSVFLVAATGGFPVMGFASQSFPHLVVLHSGVLWGSPVSVHSFGVHC